MLKEKRQIGWAILLELFVRNDLEVNFFMIILVTWTRSLFLIDELKVSCSLKRIKDYHQTSLCFLFFLYTLYFP